jgi:hypothetical protein
MAVARSRARRRATGSWPFVGGLLLVALLIAGCEVVSPLPSTCCTHGPTAAPGGLSEEAATARALSVAPEGGQGTTVVWASIESNPFVPRGANPPGPLVWIVRLAGGLDIAPCPSGVLGRVPTSSDPACLDADGGADVVLDYFTGDVLGWIH